MQLPSEIDSLPNSPKLKIFQFPKILQVISQTNEHKEPIFVGISRVKPAFWKTGSIHDITLW